MREGKGINTTEHFPRPAATARRGVPILLVEDNPDLCAIPVIILTTAVYR